MSRMDGKKTHKTLGRRGPITRTTCGQSNVSIRTLKTYRIVQGLKKRWAIVICMVTHIAKSMDQPGKVANPARGQLKRENEYSLSAFAPENLVSRDGFGSPVTCQPAHLHTQAESGAYLRNSSRVPQRHPFIYFKPPIAMGSVPSLSGRAIAYRWRSLRRVNRYRASKPRSSSERVLTGQVTMDQSMCASLPHTHY